MKPEPFLSEAAVDMARKSLPNATSKLLKNNPEYLAMRDRHIRELAIKIQQILDAQASQ